MKFGGGPDNYAAGCDGHCTGTCEKCALNRERAAVAAVRPGIHVLLVNFDEDSGAGRHFTREERAAVAAVRAWLKGKS